MRHRTKPAADRTRREGSWPGAGRRTTLTPSRRRRGHGEGGVRHAAPRGSSDRWLVSYADFITLLFAFFTTLYAASTVDTLKMGTMVQSMQVAFDAAPALPRGRRAQPSRGEAVPPPGDSMPIPIDIEPYRLDPIPLPTSGYVPAWAEPVDAAVTESPTPPDPSVDHSSLGRLLARLSQQLGEEIVRGRVAVEMDRRGLVVSIREAGSFDIGSADLSSGARRLVTRLADPLAALPNPIRVEGHTDDLPIHTSKFGSNWELSTARAVNVVAFLVDRMGFDATRLSAAGYSEFRPRFPNDSAPNRARNRRVDLIVLDPDVSQSEEPLVPEGTDD